AEMRGPVQCVLLDLIARHHPVEDAQRVRLVGAHLTAAPAQLLGARRSDETREPLRAARARERAEQDLGLADTGVLRADAEVARERELASASERVAAHRGDDR